MKLYDLDPVSIGSDTYIVMSKGHHDFKKFMTETLNRYDWPLGNPVHIWMRTVPAHPTDEYSCLYVEATPGSRGAFPVTLVHEAYGADRWTS